MKKALLLLFGFAVFVVLCVLAAIGLPAQLQCRLSLVCEHGFGYYIGQFMYIVVWPIEFLLRVIGSDSLRIRLYLFWFLVIGFVFGFLVEYSRRNH
ncbi:MAG: hypothetical protein Q7S74_06490 [Nanoarchaeota archaeon]|nr:hypothetical protein [Nanoarchaeota archaeon]